MITFLGICLVFHFFFFFLGKNVDIEEFCNDPIF